MTLRTIELGGVLVPIAASVELVQTYELFGGRSVLRMMSGAAVIQQHWSKLRTTINGGGLIPAGLSGLDYSQPLLLKCAAPRGVCSASNVIALPSSRRSDTGYEPTGYAQLATGQQIKTPVAMGGDVATLTPVTGAIAYTCNYTPQMTVVCDGPRERFDVQSARPAWDLTAEEA